MLTEWLESGTESQKRHAANRLALDDPIQAILAPIVVSQSHHYPPLTEQLANGLGAVASFVASGFELADETEQARRLDICHACEHFEPPSNRCDICGCRMDIKVKAAAWHCPLAEPKW